MGRKSKFTKEVKLQAVNDYLDGNKSTVKIAYDLQCNKSAVQSWIHGFKSQGESFFDNKTVNSSYSKELKIQVVNEYLSNTCSLLDLVNKYKISSKDVVRNWVLMYNKGKELKEYNFNPEVYKMKARKTTFEERKEIVNYCITHSRDYKGTAEKYEVSYGQVRSWVKKYNDLGEDGLVDKRGHHKSDEEASELERLRRENARLKRQLEEKDMVVELLKKVKEFERRRS